MIDYVNALKTSWYISPPWGKTIPTVEVNLLERVYLKTTRTFGYCSGVQWKHECWLYTVICGDEIFHATEYQIIGTGQLQTLSVPKPAFVLGQKVILSSYGDGTKQRLILGVVLVDKFWFYLVELISPALIKTLTILNRFSLVGEKNLVRVNA
ncbi:DUF1392 domain-containing protein [Nostoc sp. ChiQUE01b]|uniref:DUF1392 domain-containing protein n=1 Tax=Nostoc sp. ChiQUE01b TaxID=3075376 RepID=UPI002AD2572C|nr:DUF1392 domain-containing protein [Nostoc sp. ChiQUE01b]MDZ8264240.1 DUF1392 domain-containing protein [Nostoc sp. ChiQUE01b]